MVLKYLFCLKIDFGRNYRTFSGRTAIDLAIRNHGLDRRFSVVLTAFDVVSFFLRTLYFSKIFDLNGPFRKHGVFNGVTIN